MSIEARAEYGEDYFEQAVRSLETYTKGEVSLYLAQRHMLFLFISL